MSSKRKPITREQWLNKATKALNALFKKRTGREIPTDVKLSVGVPVGRDPRKFSGQCFPRALSTAKVNEIFINPLFDDPAQTMETLAHELVHAIDDCKSGHRTGFSRIALALGFSPPMKSTPATVQLKKDLARIIKRLPPFPHKRILWNKRKRQGTRLIKLECGDCGFICRSSATAIERSGPPFCGCGADCNDGTRMEIK